MFRRLAVLVFFFNLTAGVAYAAEANQQPESIAPATLKGYSQYPAAVQQLIKSGLTLTEKKLTYTYGAADPAAGGMDCSGTIYYLLKSMGLGDVPRSSHLIYKWVWQQGRFYAVNSDQTDSFEFSHLQPGDLLFWSGTYATDHDPDVTHVMLYLGKNQQGKPLMMGSSNGRTYNGRKIYGVSVFDFNLPAPGSKSRFLGYSCTPHINCQPKS